MPRVTITIEDLPNGGVRAAMSPTFETMLMMVNSGADLSCAQAYAIHAIRKVFEESKRQDTADTVPRSRFLL